MSLDVPSISNNDTEAPSSGDSSLQLLSSYVPRDLLDILGKGHDQDGVPYEPKPHFVEFDAAILFVDVSGFTALSNKLAKEGASGSEKLFKNINEYLTKMQNIVELFKGVLYAFAGDALIVAFKDRLVCTGDQCTITIPSLTACQCARMLQEECSNFETSAGVTLTLHCAISVGRSLGCHVGHQNDSSNRLHYVLSSGALKDIAEADEQANVGEVMLTPEVWKAVSKFCKGTERQKGCVLLEEVLVDPVAGLGPAAKTNRSRAHTREIVHEGGDANELRSRLMPYVPEVVQLMEHVTVDENWMAEQRVVTVAFVNLSFLLPKSSNDFDEEFFQKFQSAVEVCQSTTIKFRGFVRQICNDDKGLVFLAIWGMPGLANEDDARLATLACLSIHRQIGNMFGEHPNIGITTGHAFCGNVGPQTRHEYTAMGLTVNLAARLMGLKMGVVCDNFTRSCIRDTHLEFSELASVVVKGKPEPVQVFSPTEHRDWLEHAQSQTSGSLSSASEDDLVGRKDELATLKAALTTLEDDDATTKAVFVEGPPGVGKTTLVEVLHAGAPVTVTAVSVRCSAAEQGTAFFPIAELMWKLMAENDLTDMRGHITYERLQRLLPEDDLKFHAHLLSEIIPTDNLPPEAAAAPTLEERRTVLPRLITALIRELASRSPILAIFEDAQWLDTASLSIMARWLNFRDRAVLLVPVIRFVTSPSQPLVDLRLHPSTTVLPVESLSAKDVCKVIKQHLSVSKLGDDVKELLCEVSRGNPLFAIELIDSMMQSKTLGIKDDSLTSLVKLSSIATPHTLQGIFIQRIDQLPAAEKFVLKIAAVLGQNSYAPLLIDLHPLNAEFDAVHESLHELIDRELLEFETTPDNEEHAKRLCCHNPKGGLTGLKISFKHVFVQEVAYKLMSDKQRRQIHLDAVRIFDDLIARNVCRVALQTHVAYISYHWDRAIGTDSPEADRRRAAQWLMRAGEAAMNKGAMFEGLDALEAAVRHREGISCDDDDALNLDLLLTDAMSAIHGGFAAAPPAERVMRRIAKKVFGDEERWLDCPNGHPNCDEVTLVHWLRCVSPIMAKFGNDNEMDDFNYIMNQVLTKLTEPRHILVFYKPFVFVTLFRGQLKESDEMYVKCDAVRKAWEEKGGTVVDLGNLFRTSTHFDTGSLNARILRAFHAGKELEFCDLWSELEQYIHDDEIPRTVKINVPAAMALTAINTRSYQWGMDMAQRSLKLNAGGEMKYLYRMASVGELAAKAYTGKTSFKEAVYDLRATLGKARGLYYYPLLIDIATQGGEYKHADQFLEQWTVAIDTQARGILYPEYHRLKGALLLARTRFPKGVGVMQESSSIPSEREQEVPDEIVEQIIDHCLAGRDAAVEMELVVLELSSLVTAVRTIARHPLTSHGKDDDARVKRREQVVADLKRVRALDVWENTSLFYEYLDEADKALALL